MLKVITIINFTRENIINVIFYLIKLINLKFLQINKNRIYFININPILKTNNIKLTKQLF